MFLTKQQRDQLRAAVRPRNFKTGEYQSTDNEKLELVVNRLKQENPGAFHTEPSLHTRKFCVQPNPARGVPHAGFVVPFKVR